MVQLVKCPILDFGSGHDLTVLEFKPCIGLCIDSAEPAWDSLSHSPCPSPACALSASLKINNKHEKKTQKMGQQVGPHPSWQQPHGAA